MSGRFDPINLGVRWALGIKYFSGLLELHEPLSSAKRFYPALSMPAQKNENGQVIFPAGRQWYEWNIDPNFWVFGITPERYRTTPILKWLSRAGGGYPSQYSGKMRHVVQKAIALNRRHFFQYGDHKTHGIYTPPGGGQGADKQRWVIEVGTEGVYTMPVDFIDERPAILKTRPQDYSQKIHDRYDYALKKDMVEPDTVVTEKRNLGERRKFRLMTGEMIRYQVYQDPADRSKLMHAVYSGAGWAFSADGQEAQIVLVAPRRYTDNNDATPYYARRFKLTIHGGSDGPTTATVQKVDEGWLYSGMFANSHIRIPYILPDGQEFNGPFTYYSGLDTSLENSVCPVYVFYDGNNPVVIRHHWGTLDGQTTEIDTRDWTPGLIRPACPGFPGSEFYGSTIASAEGVWESQITGAGYYAYFSVDNLLDFPQHVSHEEAFRSRVYWVAEEVHAEAHTLCNTVEGTWLVWQTFYKAYDQGIIGYKDSVLHYAHVLVIPMREREAAYLFTRESITTTPWTETLNWSTGAGTTSSPYLAGGSPPGDVIASNGAGVYINESFVDYPGGEGIARDYYLIRAGESADDRLLHWSGSEVNASDTILDLESFILVNHFNGAYSKKYLAFPWLVENETNTAYPIDEAMSQKLAFVGDETETERPA